MRWTLAAAVSVMAAGAAPAAMQTDVGVNLGLQLKIGSRFEGDVEMAMLRLYDPFTDSIRF